MAIEAVIGVLIAILSLAIAYQTYSLKKLGTVKTDAEGDATVRAELIYIRKGVDDIRYDLKDNERKINDMGERVTRVEESTKQAHKRLDTIEKGGE
ncbi:hypothetical protein KO561_12805 [Radiobacillus kanasensis]|uniref:hypothetical protein n=1 Tax=Radiobacillus kanasensis TaxID=2844358 RepID=UPI001E6165F4|nr:hypothetical protein [Radiobacillus kanasensis]UFT98082.1 hypothetical protein KO561_12805 [Radiobacillus kanasensis]